MTSADVAGGTRERVAKMPAIVVSGIGSEASVRRRREQLAGEEPLEIRVHAPGGLEVGRVTTMRTPGDDFALAAGLLLAEGVVAGREDIAQIVYCDDVDVQRFNVVTVRLAAQPRRALGARTLAATASCGVCGTATLDELEERIAPVASSLRVDAGVLATLPDALREAQPIFSRTGGLHAAGLATADGAIVDAREDVGRHNALDKVLGRALLGGGIPAEGRIAVLSGRVSFELVQKAAAAGVPMVCAVSAPSSLAVVTAERLGVTLVAFARGDRCTVYSHPGRVTAGGEPLS